MSYFNNIFSEFENNGVITGLNSNAKALYLYNDYIQNNRNIVVVENTLYEATKIYQNISEYTENVLFFPMDDFLTSESIAMSPELKLTRLETLSSLLKDNKFIIVTNLMGFLRYLPAKEVLNNNILNIEKGKEYDINELAEQLVKIGYNKESFVTNTGEFAKRGYVLDIYGVFDTNPVRLEFFDTEIESIKYFDPETQRTTEFLDEIKIKPNTELLIEENDKYYNIKKYIKVDNILGYIDNYKLYYDELGNIENEYKLIVREVIDYNKSINENNTYMFELDCYLKENYIELVQFNKTIQGDIIYTTSSIEEKIRVDLKKYLFDSLKNKTVIICCKNRYQVNKLLDLIEDKKVIFTNEKEIFDKKINIIIKGISQGFIINNTVIISDNEIFNNSNVKKYKSNYSYGSKIRDINKLVIGDYVVHSIHGIGKYMGLTTLESNGMKKDYLVIEYQKKDKLYIPVDKIEYISKFSSKEGAAPKINKLGSAEWENTKKKIRKKIESIASDLIELYAKREKQVGFAFQKDDEMQLDFDNQFEYIDTKDQEKTTKEIKKDMESSHPMDRLLCGDVGYGKTEVAFRAIFKAVLSGKQVALLCPTTILSSQHFSNALKRFSDFPVTIELLNRYVTPKKTNQILKDLKEGKIDIIIGTHKLLNDKVIYNNLGLLVIDEEQRFGVTHKEKIKMYKNNIDVLTLSATPIPRTLQMSLIGIRNLSLIETPPPNRYPVQTYVLKQNDMIIKDAVYKEISRGGQVFILFNNVKEMADRLLHLQKIFPDLKIAVGHGRMHSHELEDTLNKFINKEFDILLCTTIIETGIDIENVNTLIIYDADRFGLSQLYQIRGRVGRTNKIAYCYLMYDSNKILSDIAVKRLEAIKEFTELGSGYSIAMRDLSIRGAGDVLGSEQSGFIDTVGIDLYLKILDEEVKRLKGIEIEEEKEDSKNLIDVSNSISDDYVNEDEVKIEIHKKINSIDSLQELLDLKDELSDRFGKINQDIENYMYQELINKKLEKLNINNIKQTNTYIEIILNKDMLNKINISNLFVDLYGISTNFKMSKKINNVVVTLNITNLDKHFTYYLFKFINAIENNLN